MMRSTRKNNTRFILLQCIITSGFLYLTFHKTHFATLHASLFSVDYRFLLLSLIPQAFSFLLLASREYFLLKKLFRFSFITLLNGALIGYVGNNILPFRAGELLKVLYWSKQSGQSYVSLLSVAFIERFIDFFILVMIFFIGAKTWMNQLGIHSDWLIITCIMIITPIAILITVDIKYKQFDLQKWANHFLSDTVSYRFNQLVNNMIAGLRILGSAKNILLSVFLSIVYWVNNALCVWLLLHAFHLHFSLSQTVVVLLATSLGAAIPSAPGYIGTYDYFAKMSVMLYGVNASLATSFALDSHFMTLVPFTLIALLFLYPTMRKLWD